MGDVHRLPTAIIVPIHPTKWEAVAIRHLNNHNPEMRNAARELLQTSASPFIREQAGPPVPIRNPSDAALFGLAMCGVLSVVALGVWIGGL
jgi:hypothetical protein